jgi:hypothetical protein
VFRWHKSFSEGQEQVKDEPRAGRPSTSETEDNVEKVRLGRRLTLTMISSELSLERFIIHQILTGDLGMRKRPCQTTVSINEFLADKSIFVIPQPPYSPDLSPCDFFLFTLLENHLKGRNFVTLDNIQKSVTDELKGIPALLR